MVINIFGGKVLWGKQRGTTNIWRNKKIYHLERWLAASHSHESWFIMAPYYICHLNWEWRHLLVFVELKFPWFSWLFLLEYVHGLWCFYIKGCFPPWVFSNMLKKKHLPRPRTSDWVLVFVQVLSNTWYAGWMLMKERPVNQLRYAVEC